MRGGLSYGSLQFGLPGSLCGGEGGDLLAQQVDALGQLADAPAHRVHVRQVVGRLAVEEALAHLVAGVGITVFMVIR